MDVVLEYGRHYLQNHPQAGGIELADALRRHFGLTTLPPDAPQPALHVNEVAVAEQGWYTIRFWWWFFRQWVWPRRPTVTTEDVDRVVTLLLPKSAEQAAASDAGGM